MSDWLDRIAADLVRVEAEVRTTLRAVSRGGTTPRMVGYGRMWISLSEARTLLRGAMPAPIAASKLRQPHARLVAALSVMAGHLVAMNDPLRSPAVALAAAATLGEELREWRRVLDWQRACRRSGVTWPVPRVSITTVLRPSVAEQTFHPSVATAAAMPNARAGMLAAEAQGIVMRALPHQLRAEQLALDLAPPPTAELVDLRQLRLSLTPVLKEKHHDHAVSLDTRSRQRSSAA